MTYEDKLSEIALSDDRVVVMTAENRAAIRSLPSRLGERFIDVGICEQTMIGAAAGLALRGRIPVVHALAAFLTMRAFEFIRTDIGIAGLPVKLVGAVPGFLSDGNGPTHQAIEDIAIMGGIPGMQVVCPADVEELVAFLPLVIESDAPCYLRFNALPACTTHIATPLIGRAETLREGLDVAILTYGFLLREALEAEVLLSRHGVSCRVVNMRSLAPVDIDVILAAAEECSLIVTLEDHLIRGALYSSLAHLFLEQRMPVDVLPIALEKWFRPGILNQVLEVEGFTADRIAQRILDRLEGVYTKADTFVQKKMFKTYL